MAEDAVVEACDVYINTSLMSHLHLLQLPSPKTAELLTDLRSVFGQDAVLSARFKPKSGLLEIDVPVDTASDTFDRDRAEAFARSAVDASNTDAVLDHKRLSGMCFPCSSGIVAVGATFQGRLFLTPVSSIVPMHVDLGHLDAADANERAASKKQATEDPDKLKPVQIQFKKRETEEQMTARMSSYAYLQRKVDDEAWIPLKLYPGSSAESAYLANRLIDYDEGFCAQRIALNDDPAEYLASLAK